MWSDHAFSAEARPPAPLSVEVVYAADADESFDARKLVSDDARRAVFRTLGGEGEVELGGPDAAATAPLRAKAGTVVFLDFHRVRRYRPVGGRWRFWFFEYGGGDDLPFPLRQPVVVGDAARDETESRECLERLREATPSSSAHASALFTLMVHRWLEDYLQRHQARDPREPRIRAVVAEMRRSLHRPMSIPALAASAGMGERAFREAFHAIVDASPKRYFSRLRLEKAAELLRQNRYTVGELADMLSYSSAFHFSRSFKELFGVPPSTYAAVMRSER